MSGLLGRLLSIGADPEDDEDTRLRKVLLLVAALTIAPLAVLWGLLYWLAGATGPALIPWAYAVISVLGLLMFALTRRYSWFAASQFSPYITLPFALMWSLGGPVDGSAVGLWAGLAPIVAMLLSHRRLATLLAGVYAALVVVTVLSPAPASSLAAPLRELGADDNRDRVCRERRVDHHRSDHRGRGTTRAVRGGCSDGDPPGLALRPHG